MGITLNNTLNTQQPRSDLPTPVATESTVIYKIVTVTLVGTAILPKLGQVDAVSAQALQNLIANSN